MKLYIRPFPQEIQSNNGIGRVVFAQHKYLPTRGVEIVEREDKADLRVTHTQMFELPQTDVLHTHGLYWTGDQDSGKYNSWHHKANWMIAKAARQARLITVPSQWVARLFQREMRLTPDVIGHGIDLDEWKPLPPSEHNGNYVLWNKNRASDVCDPLPAYHLAGHGINTVVTFSPPGKPILDTLKVTGIMSQDAMRPIVQKAHIYLATTQETFGIGTLEAMASGVPVLGYRWAGTGDLVKHQVNGYLVEPGNLDGLVEGYHWLEDHWDEMSRQAMETAQLYSWDNSISLYVESYTRLLNSLDSLGDVSIVIPCYNYGRYVGQAIDSALAQTIPCKVVVVDDGSTDDTESVCRSYGDRITYIRKANEGVAAARNDGIRRTSSDFIICLDADDTLDHRYVEVLRKAMMDNRGLGIAYAGLTMVSSDGPDRFSTFPPPFSWAVQASVGVPPPNCIPSAAMFRRSMWERCGGYRQCYAPGEDAEFWLRGLSTGFEAQRIVEDGLFHYRLHGPSESRTKPYIPIHTWFPYTQDFEYPFFAPAAVTHARSYSDPVVTVIIPVGDGHEEALPMALESLLGQFMRNWDVIVIDDTSDGELLMNPSMRPYPFIRYAYTPGTHGTGNARNIGLDMATSPLVLFLDADDYLHPQALWRMFRSFLSNGGKYVYTDWVNVKETGEGTISQSADYSPEKMLELLLHPVTVMIDTQWAKEVRFGNLRYFEDWNFFAQCAIRGYHGTRLAEPLVYVRTYLSGRTPDAERKKPKFWKATYGDYITGKRPFMACCGQSPSMARARGMASSLPTLNDSAKETIMVRMKFNGDQTGAITYGGRGVTVSGRSYRGANNAFNKFIDASPEDVEWLERSGAWTKVTVPPKVSPIPSTDELAMVSAPEVLPVRRQQLSELVKKLREQASLPADDPIPMQTEYQPPAPTLESVEESIRVSSIPPEVEYRSPKKKRQ